MTQPIQQLFDTIAPRYDLLNSVLSWGLDRHWRQEAVSPLKGPEFNHILDLCAGTLALTTAFLETNPDGHVTAIDFSQEMLDCGWKNLAPAFQKRVTLQSQDILKADILPHSYDAVMCAYGLRNVSDNKSALKKIKAWLKPGGKLIVLEFLKPEKWWEKLFDKTYAQIVIPLLGGLISRHPKAYRHLRDSIRNYYTSTEFKDLLQHIGFKNISIKSQRGGSSSLITAEVL